MTKRKTKRKEIKCKCYKGDGYDYSLADNQTLLLCDNCNMLLAEQLFSQLAVEVFAKDEQLDVDLLNGRIDNLRDYVIRIDKRTKTKK